jgi:hypothetical protein
MNWRGLFSMGTNPSGGASTTPVEWPGFRTIAWHYTGETQGQTKNWMGSVHPESARREAIRSSQMGRARPPRPELSKENGFADPQSYCLSASGDHARTQPRRTTPLLLLACRRSFVVAK